LGNQVIFDAAAFALFLVSRMDAITPLYGEWARDFCMLEAGLMTQLLETSAPAYQIGLCQVGGFDFEFLRHWFALQESHVYLHSLLGGPIEPRQTHLQALLEDSGDLDALLKLSQERKQDRSIPEQLAPLAAVQRAIKPGSHDALADDLRSFLEAKLPAYMVPSAYVLLEALPLTPNGKVDRHALPLPERNQRDPERALVAPQTETERAIAAIWQEVLQVEQVDVHSSFFDLGGTSVHLVQVHNKLREILDRDTPITKMFEHPTIHTLAEYMNLEQSHYLALQQSSDQAAIHKGVARQRQRRSRSRQRQAAKEHTRKV
jgi:epothilone synthetase B